MTKGSKNNGKRNLVLIAILFLIVGISIGYAALSTTLNINGTANISSVGWDVHFENLKVTSGSVTASTPAAINTATTAVNYSVSLVKPGDYYEFTVDVVNDGTLTAKLSDLTIGGLTTAADVYTNYTVTYSDGSTIAEGDTIAAGATKTLKVRVAYDSNVSASQLPTTATSLNLTVATIWVQG